MEKVEKGWKRLGQEIFFPLYRQITFVYKQVTNLYSAILQRKGSSHICLIWNVGNFMTVEVSGGSW